MYGLIHIFKGVVFQVGQFAKQSIVASKNMEDFKMVIALLQDKSKKDDEKIALLQDKSKKDDEKIALLQDQSKEDDKNIGILQDALEFEQNGGGNCYI
jgi:hypothetical protein